MNGDKACISRGSSWLWTAVALVLGACGSPSESNGTPTSGAAASSTTSVPAAPAAATPVPAKETSAVQESADTATVHAGPGGEEILLASAASTPASAATPATAAGAKTTWRYQAGQDYKVLGAAQGTSTQPDKIEVAEVFWYGCPHCYNLDPRLQDWVKKLPADVSFVRIPVMWGPLNQLHARVFYTAQALGKLGQMHDAIFREIHVNNNRLENDDQIQALFLKFGVSADDFQKTYKSFTVEGNLKRAKELMTRYEIRSVPILVVNGKFTTDAPGIKSYDDMFGVVDELIARERQRK